MATTPELTAPIWIALVVLVFALVYRIFLYIISRWYRDVYLSGYQDVGEGVFIPTEWRLVSSYFSMQPMNNNTRYQITMSMSSPLRYIWVYITAIATCIFLLYSMQCSVAGGCETYAWIYVGFISCIFIIDLIKTLYDYSEWKQYAQPKSIKYA